MKFEVTTEILPVKRSASAETLPNQRKPKPLRNRNNPEKSFSSQIQNQYMHCFITQKY